MSPQPECPVEPRSNRLPGRRNDLPDGVFDAVGNESFRQRRHGFGCPGRDALRTSAARKHCIASDVHRGSVGAGPEPRPADIAVGRRLINDVSALAAGMASQIPLS
jgi:hypothetical protein